jgi:protein-disulfide isomerase
VQANLKTAVVGGLVGAVVAVAVMAGAVALHVVPTATDARLQSYLLGHPKLVLQMQALAEEQQAAEARQAQIDKLQKLGLKKFLDPNVAFVTGPANAKNTVIEFYDYNCGHCRNTSAAVKAFMDKHKADTRFAFIEFPIFGDASTKAALASIAAHKQGDKFLALHFGLMAESSAVDQNLVREVAQKSGLDVAKLTADLNAPETDKALLAGYRLAREMNFSGTPMFIVNGQVHEGEITEDELTKLVK